ncbi:hypothetical protein LPTSP3_g12070 [Leptospira kobayashii]|uniref:Lipoprotein n=1 Tax=Leptospira kobayashii TaxID=1917830 RepID=A0ABM7UI44_9LEPT|nr:hypothetical protein [Leptospira kobayashii]BDA78277.1 hypothetical protein LPTSP3_g12070 [Leptospira kobayashii]
MKKISLSLLVALFAIVMVNCASNDVKEPTQNDINKLQEPKPSKKPTLNEALKQRSRDIK